MFSDIGSFFTEGFGLLNSQTGLGLGGIVETIGSMFGPIAAGAQSIGSAISSGVVSFFPSIFAGLGTLVTSVGSAMAAMMQAIAAALSAIPIAGWIAAAAAVAGAVALIATIASIASNVSNTPVDEPTPAFQAKKYAKGTRGVKKGQIANVDEKGEELIVRNPDQGRMTYLEKGDGVIPAKQTDNLMAIGEDPEGWLARGLAKTAKSSAREPTAAQDAGASCTGEGSSNWLSRWKQRQEIRKSHYAAAHSGTAAQTAGGKAVSNGASAARSGVEQAVEKGKTAVSTAVKGLMNAAKGNAHVLVIVGVFVLLILMVMSGFSSCGILFSGGTQVSGQTMYSAEDRDIRGAEQDYKKLEKELDKKIKRTPTDHPGYNEYQYHLDPIEHDPWQLTSFLTTLYDDYTRSEVQSKLKETFKKQYKLTTWVEVQIRYKTVWVISPAGIPVPTQVPYEYRIFHTKLVNRGLEVVIWEELD